MRRRGFGKLAAALTGAAVAAALTVGPVRATSGPTTMTGSYVTPSTGLTACLTANGTKHCTGGTAFDVSSSTLANPTTGLATIDSIVIQDQALAGVDGDWTINDKPQLGKSVLNGYICNGTFVGDATSPTTFVPTTKYTMFVGVAAPGDSVAGCNNAGTPTATAGTITVTFN